MGVGRVWSGVLVPNIERAANGSSPALQPPPALLLRRDSSRRSVYCHHHLFWCRCHRMCPYLQLTLLPPLHSQTQSLLLHGYVSLLPLAASQSWTAGAVVGVRPFADTVGGAAAVVIGATIASAPSGSSDANIESKDDSVPAQP